MKFLTTTIAAASLLAASPNGFTMPGEIKLTPIGTYASGVFDLSAAEIVAHDPATQRLFVINAQAAAVDVLSIANPASPIKVGTISVASYGAVANSVAVRAGIIAVAVESNPKTANGKVVFFDSNLNFISQVSVGAQPDMITFTPNGRYVLTANEAEPDGYGPGYTDPEGSVSIIDVMGNLSNLNQSKVRTARFTAFNGAVLDASVRISGPGATVAQDLEPEYITVSQDSKTAYVTCQENNAIVTIDIDSAKVTGLKGLGFKDHSKVQAAATIYTFNPASLPSIGTTAAGQSIALGGFSGLHFEGINPANGRLKFVTHTDRGPNAEPTGLLRPFLLPDFAPELVRFELDRASGVLSLTQRIPLKRAPGDPLTGLPNTAISASASTPYNDEVPVDLLANVLPLDPLGGDFEGVVIDPADGSFWMCDEYRPAIYHFDTAGVLIKRYVPIGTAAAAGQAVGTFGDEVLPAILAQRRQNRGFEGIALDDGKVYAVVQSPLRNPETASNGSLNGNRSVRLVEFNPATLATRQFLYVMDNPNLGGADNTRADKIGDLVSFGNGEFLIIERDDDKISTDAFATIEKKIYRFNLTGATEISGYTNNTVGATGKTVDQLTPAELAANGINPLIKMLHVDLNAAGYNTVEKVEGLTIIDPWTLAVINDNDFGIAAISVNPDGTFTVDYTPEPEQLGLIHIRGNQLDASDRDDNINIRQWPLKGVYMPDAIASYKVGNETFLVTANEGDAREWPGLTEPVRVGSGSVALDPAVFPNPGGYWKNNGILGRLNIISGMGRNPVTGLYEELYSFGARSFSIWDTAGKQVFDSADDLEWITAFAFPDNFNASNSSNSRDSRSDDKGPEPEGVTIGKVAGRTYAFIGLERIGGVVTYDVCDPHHPFFVDYVNNRDFTKDVDTAAAGDLGPEGIIFIKEEDSPNGKPLVVIGNEVSGTTTVYEINLVQ